MNEETEACMFIRRKNVIYEKWSSTFTIKASQLIFVSVKAPIKLQVIPDIL